MRSRDGDWPRRPTAQARYYGEARPTCRAASSGWRSAACAGRRPVSSEIPGAYPNDYLPGLLTPRILKGRPMGGFFNRVADQRRDAQDLPQGHDLDHGRRPVGRRRQPGRQRLRDDRGHRDAAALRRRDRRLPAGPRRRRPVGRGDGPARTWSRPTPRRPRRSSRPPSRRAPRASGTAITAATPFAGALGNVIAYYAARFKPALGQFVPSALFASCSPRRDTTGRPMMPLLSPTNSRRHRQRGRRTGSILGATTYLSYASTANVVVTARPDDYVIFESSIARFSYDAVTGPPAVRLGIWAYLVVGARQGGLKVTAA